MLEGILVLTRKPGQIIRIDDDIEIVVVEVRCDRVRLGVRAPGHPVHRQEVYEAIHRDTPPERNPDASR